MPIISLTDLAIRSLKPGVYFDQKTPAFGLRVGKNRKTWLVLKEPNRTKVRIGHYPALSLSDARKKALVAIGSPYHSPTAPTFPEAVEAFLALDRWKPYSKYQISRNIKAYFKWTKTLDKITSNDVAAVIEGIRAKSQSAHCLKDIRTFFAWCVPRYIPNNPCDGLKGPRYKPRQRTLTDDELRAVWKAADKVPKPFGAIVRLLILSGARKSEIASLTWANVRQETLTFPETKSGRTHIIPMTPLMKGIIEAQKETKSPYVFPGRTGKAWNGWVYKADLDKASRVKGATIHDLRRTFAHNWQRMGVRLEITEAALGHLGTRGGIVGVYQTYAYTDELKTRYALWDKHLQMLLGVGGQSD